MGSYFDHNATTPLDPQVLDVMRPYLHGHFGNPSSVHAHGRKIREALDQARQQVASLVGVSAAQVIFTSGGTEANNFALKGCLPLLREKHLAVSAIEHASVLRSAEWMAQCGVKLDILAVTSDGRISDAEIEKGITSRTGLVSVMMANNETGVIQEIERVAARARQVGALMHTDAVQMLGKLPIDFASTGVHMMSLSSHKIYGPSGVGALIVERSIDLVPLLHGGGQESGLRGGTENIAGIVGFGAAAEKAAAQIDEDYFMLDQLHRYLELKLLDVPDVTVFAKHSVRLPNTTYLAIPGIDGEALLMALDEQDIALSSGSACESHQQNRPSHVLMAMGVEESLARSAVRVSLGRGNSKEDIDKLIDALLLQITGLRSHAMLAWG